MVHSLSHSCNDYISSQIKILSVSVSEFFHSNIVFILSVGDILILLHHYHLLGVLYLCPLQLDSAEHPLLLTLHTDLVLFQLLLVTFNQSNLEE